MQSTFIISNNNVRIKYVKFFKYIFKMFKCCVTRSHEDDSDDDDNSKHACIITVFLLVKLLYLLIHLLDYLFRSIQTLTIFTNLINLIVMSLLITCCLLNSSSKSIFLQCLNIILFFFCNKKIECNIK